ncbi:MAG: GNAT family N-acetyltransferase [Alphaproteobacteria bacterium]|nr:GNAT family N-acetyltransferase [Alphaproteobacteria bacterium]OJV14101.1 MAG: GNAT family N-acetyltransferase [Alphaproteobacteria bacterium 33-17]
MIIIQTDRLILRKWKDEDIKPFALMNQDPKVIEFLRGSMNEEEAKKFLEVHNNAINSRGYSLFAAELKETNELIGFIGLSQPIFKATFTPCVEIAWRLGSQFWGKGYASEGAKACLEFGFNQLNLKEIVAFTVPDNINSRKVMERIGMVYDAAADFNHPLLPIDHKLSKHVLYRIKL